MCPTEHFWVEELTWILSKEVKEILEFGSSMEMPQLELPPSKKSRAVSFWRYMGCSAPCRSVQQRHADCTQEQVTTSSVIDHHRKHGSGVGRGERDERIFFFKACVVLLLLFSLNFSKHWLSSENTLQNASEYVSWEGIAFGDKFKRETWTTSTSTSCLIKKNTKWKSFKLSKFWIEQVN